MEDLISKQDIEKITNIGRSQFKSFRRRGLIDGHVKKTAIVKRDDEKSQKKGRDYFSPAGFQYFYPRNVLTQISWILDQQKKGKNLEEIHKAFIRKKIKEEEDLKIRANEYERIITIPNDPEGKNSFKKKLIGNAVMDLTRLIKQDNVDRDIRTLVFVVEAVERLVEHQVEHQVEHLGEYHSNLGFNKSVRVKLDADNSIF
ncbi:MAG: hypothetical protein J7K96_09205 [Desulfobacteraceae bacterium]|nr:hypothetical protein [Desulfobacteraceae bacterium]